MDRKYDSDHENHAAGDRRRQHELRKERKGADQYGNADGDEQESKSATKKEGGNKKKDRQQQQRVAFVTDGSTDGGMPPSVASLAEILAAFGFVFEGAGAAVKPSVAEAFAMLRLHAQPAEARAAGEAARRYSRANLRFF